MAKKPGDKKHNPYIKYLLHGAIITGVIVAAISYLDWEEVIDALWLFNLAYLKPILIISAGYVFLKAWRFILLIRPVTDLPSNVIFRGFVAGTAATILPGGVAARAGLMRQVGVPVANSTGPVILSSLLDQIAFVLGALVSAIWFQPARLPAFYLLLAILVATLTYILQPSRRWIVKAIHWASIKLKIQSQWTQFRQAWQLVATPQILSITFSMTLVCILMQVIMLDFSLRGIGLVLPYPLLFLAYILPAIIGRNSALPGGFGITEASMIGFLALTADIDLNLGAAAIAIFRVTTVFFQILLGAAFYFFAWQGEGERAKSST
jgi:uncharacterized protein (TIRG00374 family)